LFVASLRSLSPSCGDRHKLASFLRLFSLEGNFWSYSWALLKDLARFAFVDTVFRSSAKRILVRPEVQIYGDTFSPLRVILLALWAGFAYRSA
jgi:hypothetical protein